MNFEDNTTEYSDRSGAKSKSTWFSAEDVCILADLVRSHSDALKNLSNSPSRNEKRKVWDIIAQLLNERTNVPRTTRQVQKKWSNLRSAVRRASRSSVGTTVLPHYFLPVVKYLEEENALDVNGSQDLAEEEVDDITPNVEDMQPLRRQTYAVKIQHIQEQQQAEAERLAVLRQIKLESYEGSDQKFERVIPENDDSSEVPQELHFTHVTLPGTENDGSITELEPDETGPIWVNEGGDNETGVEHSEADDVYFQQRQDDSRRHVSGTRKRLRPWPDWEEKNEDDAREMKLEILKAQLLLVQKETSLTEKEIVKKDKEISLIDKEILKLDLEISFMKKRHRWEEMKMGNYRK